MGAPIRIFIAISFLLVFVKGLLVGQAPGPPAVADNGVVNAATFVQAPDPSHPNAPGSIVSIFGARFATPSTVTLSAQTIPLTTSLGGVSVAINNTPVPLIVLSQSVVDGVSNAQINAQLPWEIDASTGTATVVVTRDGVQSEPAEILVAPASPGIFTFQFGPGLSAVTNIRFPGFPDEQVVNDSIAQPEGSVCAALGIPAGSCTVVDQPAPVGGIISIFANGLGAVDGPVTTGASASPNPGDPLLNALADVRVLIGGQPAQVLFKGLHPTLVGLNQINAIVPNIQPANNVPIQLEVEVNGQVFRSRNDVTIAVRQAGNPIPTASVAP